MKFKGIIFGCSLAVGIAYFCFVPARRARAALGDTTVPAIVQNGFNAWVKKNTASYAFDVWRKGGLLEQDKKPDTLARFFSRIDGTVGAYQSFDVVQEKKINQSSEILYVSVNFEHAAVFGRFQLYRTTNDWVVQNMDFNAKPEAVMPWLAFAGDSDPQ